MSGSDKNNKPDLSKRSLLFGKRRVQDEAIEQGVAYAVVSDSCLAMNGVSCRACEDPCLEDAISFRPQFGGRETPIIDNQACTGCGDCLAICPASALYLGGRKNEMTS